MATWSKNQIAVMARSVGWGARSEDAAEVALAESGGNDHIVNSIGCVGLMQINQPVFISTHPKWTTKWLQDPIHNLEAGLVLYKDAGRFDGPWLDSRDKGGGGGWGSKVSGKSGGTGASQTKDDPCDALKGTPGYEYCTRGKGDNTPDGVPDLEDAAAQIGRIAQAVAKAANWLADPANWVRIVYVAGGGVLALVAVNTVVQPYAARAYRQVTGALPVQTTKNTVRRMRTTSQQEET